MGGGETHLWSGHDETLKTILYTAIAAGAEGTAIAHGFLLCRKAACSLLNSSMLQHFPFRNGPLALACTELNSAH